ncbi:MAG: AraC family transcriptional regulator [Cyanobacteria bacterium P01_F01_bin.143]
MKATFSVNNQQEFYQEIQQHLGRENYDNGFERCILIHPRIGKGRICRFQFSSGLELQIQEYLTEEPIALEGKIDYTNLGICWVISGHSNYSVENNDFCLKPQQQHISYFGDVRCRFDLAPNKKVVFVGLSLEKYFRQPNFVTQQRYLPIRLNKLLNSNLRDIFWQTGRTTPEMNLVLQQIINCPYQGVTKQLYLESKSLELIALELAYLEQNKNNTKLKYQPKKDEVERLYQARKIIQNNLDNPPSLNSLAKQIGLNEYKLKQGFRAVFDNTVFGYLHDYRMERSHLLLTSGAMNVTEVAQTVGYTNLSHFAVAFRKKYGVNPSVIKKIN